MWQFFSVELWDTTRVGGGRPLVECFDVYGALTRWIPGSDPVVLWAVLAATVAAAGLAIAGFWVESQPTFAAVVVGITVRSCRRLHGSTTGLVHTRCVRRDSAGDPCVPIQRPTSLASAYQSRGSDGCC